MNIFRPYLDNDNSVSALDNKRLNKQILECWQIYNIAKQINADPNAKVGYMHHPVVQYYKQYPVFVLWYAYEACLEHWCRFSKDHKLFRPVVDELSRLGVFYDDTDRYIYPPIFYCEGSKTDKNCKRIIGGDADILFKQKLFDKWDKDETAGRPPQWSRKMHKLEREWRDWV